MSDFDLGVIAGMIIGALITNTVWWINGGKFR